MHTIVVGAADSKKLHTTSWVQLSKILSVKLRIFSYSSVLTYVLCAQKNRLIEMVLFSTHNICF